MELPKNALTPTKCVNLPVPVATLQFSLKSLLYSMEFAIHVCLHSSWIIPCVHPVLNHAALVKIKMGVVSLVWVQLIACSLSPMEWITVPIWNVVSNASHVTMLMDSNSMGNLYVHHANQGTTLTIVLMTVLSADQIVLLVSITVEHAVHAIQLITYWAWLQGTASAYPIQLWVSAPFPFVNSVPLAPTVHVSYVNQGTSSQDHPASVEFI
jgi:hypothetical protein